MYRQNFYTHQPRAMHPYPRVTRAVQRIILLNILVFASQLLCDAPLLYVAAMVKAWLPGWAIRPEQFAGMPGGLLTSVFAFDPARFIRGAIWMPVTYAFFHVGLMHLFQNMLFLYFFGTGVERVLGTRQFYRFFIFCGALGVLATFVPMVLGLGNPLVLGASGAVLGVLVAFAMIDPEREIFLFPLPVPINARALVAIVVAYNLISALLIGSNLSVATHFGGMLAGYAYMKWARDARRMWSRMFQRPSRPRASDIGDAVDNIFRFEDEKKQRRR